MKFTVDTLADLIKVLQMYPPDMPIEISGSDYGVWIHGYPKNYEGMITIRDTYGNWLDPKEITWTDHTQKEFTTR